MTQDQFVKGLLSDTIILINGKYYRKQEGDGGIPCTNCAFLIEYRGRPNEGKCTFPKHPTTCGGHFIYKVVKRDGIKC
jgi:hypothetical protein